MKFYLQNQTTKSKTRTTMKKPTTLLLCLCFVSANATSWRLNNNPAVDADFRSFAEAHDAASPGDTIYVEGNGEQNSYGTLTISKKLVIIGPGYFLNQNDSTYANPLEARTGGVIIEASAAGTEIYGLFIYSTGGVSLQDFNIGASDVIVSRNRFELGTNNELLITQNVQNVTVSQNYIYTLIISGSATNLLIANNYVHQNINSNANAGGVFVNNITFNGIQNVYNSQIKNNMVLNAGQGQPFSHDKPGNYIAYNLVAGTLPAGDYGPGNIGNVDMSTVFIGYPAQGNYSSDGRWQLKPDGPAVGAGEGGIDCGMFGGPLPYVLSGLPAIPRIYEAVVPVAGSTSTGLPVIIKAKSQN